MQEWRKTNDENMKMKQAKIEQIQSKLEKSDKELSRIKAENGMLRKN